MQYVCSMYAVCMPNMCSKVTGMYAACIQHVRCMYAACMWYACSMYAVYMLNIKVTCMHAACIHCSNTQKPKKVNIYS